MMFRVPVILLLLLSAPCLWAQSADPYFELKVMEARSNGLDRTAECVDAVNGFKHRLASERIWPAGDDDVRKAYERFCRVTGGERLSVLMLTKKVRQQDSPAEIGSAMTRMGSVCSSLKRGESLGQIKSDYPDVRADSMVISVTELPADVEKRVSVLNQGDVTEPFVSYEGVHVVKLIAKAAVSYDVFATEYNRSLSGTALAGMTASAAVQHLKDECGFSENKSEEEQLLRGKPAGGALFSIGGRPYGYDDFIGFAEAYPGNRKTQLEAFVIKSLVDHKDSLLVATDPDIERQSEDYLKRYLVDRITFQKVIQPSMTDEAGLYAYFSTHRKDYYWPQPKYRHYVVWAKDRKTCSRVAKAVRKAQKKGLPIVLDERQRANSMVEEVITQDSEFQPSDISRMTEYPYVRSRSVKVNGPDDYNEVREQLMADYRNYLEREWIGQLRDKYGR